MSAARRILEVVDLGRIAYAAALDLQHRLVEERAAGAGRDRLLFAEHDDVVTIGRGGDRFAAGASPFPVVEVERGGEATWHGPGQLVGYPILGLEGAERDLHRYLRGIEDALVRALGDLGVAAGRNPPHTGVWIGGAKVASIGVAVRRWVTFHGFALNVAPDLLAFGGFRPCGLDPGVMTSLAAALGAAPAAGLVRARVAVRFAEVFDRALAPVESGAGRP